MAFVLDLRIADPLVDLATFLPRAEKGSGLIVLPRIEWGAALAKPPLI